MAARILNVIIGIGLLAAPDLLGYDGAARASHLIAGPSAAAIATIAMSEVLRELRWLNLAIGAWLVASPLILPHPTIALVVGVSSGIGLVLLSLVKGPIRHRLGGGWRAAIEAPDHAPAAEGDEHG